MNRPNLVALVDLDGTLANYDKSGWLEHRPRGLVIMPDQPWNIDFQHANVIRATTSNLHEVEVRIVETMQQTLRSE